MREVTSPGFDPNDAQSVLEREFVSIFSDLADLFGNPRSHGAIYGLLFSSERPLSMEEIVTRLEISKGSASQGLRQLEDLGAILRARENGERIHTYVARIELKPLIAGFLHKRLTPRLNSSAARLKEIEKLLTVRARIQPARAVAPVDRRRLTRQRSSAETAREL